MFDELRRNASSDKESVLELQRRTTELEAEMIKLKGDHADEKNKMVEDKRKAVPELETKIDTMKDDHNEVESSQAS